MANLLAETIEKLTQCGKTSADVKWVGSQDGRFAISWDAFAVVANIDYHDGFGGNEIVLELVIVGKGWWLERGEYDGSEWWDFKTIPRKNKPRKFTNVRNENHRNELS